MVSNAKNDVIDEIKRRLNLSDLIASQTTVITRGGKLKALCPFHQEKTPSLVIDNTQGVFHCFGCHSSGDHISFVEKIFNFSFKESLQYLADLVGIALPEAGSNFNSNKISNELLRILDLSANWFTEMLRRSHGEKARDYLGSRGITDAAQSTFRLGYAPETGLDVYLTSQGFSQIQLIAAGITGQKENGATYLKFRKRLIFPITNEQGRVVGFGGRTLNNTEPKYLNSQESLVFHKKNTLYGLTNYLQHLGRLKKNTQTVSQQKSKVYDNLIVVEGYLDVIRLHQEGIYNVVAPLGTALTAEQLQLLWKYSRIPIIAFDGDSAGKQAALMVLEKSLKFITAARSLRLAFLPEEHDPDSYVVNYQAPAFLKLLEEKSYSPHEIIWGLVCKQHNLNNIGAEEILTIKANLDNYLIKIENKTVKEIYSEMFFTKLNSLLAKLKNQNVRRFNNSNVLAINTILIKDLELILLVCLMNHSWLFNEVVESLMNIKFEDTAYEDSRILIIQYLSDKNNVNIWPEPLAKLLENHHLNDKAPFIFVDEKPETVKKGWQDTYDRLYTIKMLNNHKNKAVDSLKANLDQQAWDQLKAVKNIGI